MTHVDLLFDLERTGNLIEACFWVVFGLALALGGWRRPGTPRRLGLLACVVSIAFGFSDLVEARTGAWWRPWWLLAWKAACVTGLMLCFLRYRQWRSAARPDQPAEGQASSSSM